MLRFPAGSAAQRLGWLRVLQVVRDPAAQALCPATRSCRTALSSAPAGQAPAAIAAWSGPAPRTGPRRRQRAAAAALCALPGAAPALQPGSRPPMALPSEPGECARCCAADLGRALGVQSPLCSETQTTAAPTHRACSLAPCCLSLPRGGLGSRGLR